ncbi:muramoyltetrapeptide carboxypeptidase [Duganella sp. sic0402]|uniref:muramoyltetrapeptide carboxypeptidase n=1 Tax=Duganella sp. sic0402 TaxID=2854786 RepID=UPI001C48F3B5|nr:muramoyltetrapeptide carboxypeptidase [Duganella sp. sic0402]MBV7534793.1 muramoyltetrapeptide carboxypeptidase [Duganella sp. sic0402]
MSTPKIGIAIAAPSGRAPDNDALLAGVRRLEQQGYLVHNYYDDDQRFQRFGGTDEWRLAQLNAAAADPAVQVVIALRGSYGMSRLLPMIDFHKMADSGKLFVGYSDFTAFQMPLLKQTGRVSFGGPMICDDFIRAEPVEYTLNQFWDCLRGPVHQVRGTVGEGGSDNPLVNVSGKLWGGNLAMLVSLLGTAYFQALNDGICFIEDISEHPYRIERMVLQLLYAGVLDRQQALVLGDFSGYKLNAMDNGYDFETMLAYLRSRLPIPVLTGLPFGHIKERATLPYGGLAHLVSSERGFDLTISDYPTL